MKCKGCGATYDPQLEYCPYCGTENVRLKRQKEAIARRTARYEKRRSQVLEQSAEDIRLGKARRLMWIAAGLLALSIVVSVGIGVMLEMADEPGRGGVSTEELEQLVEQERWQALEQSLYEADRQDESFDEFYQIEIFSRDMEYLQEYRNEYLHLDREEYEAAFRGDASMDSYDREYCESHFAFLVEQILSSCQDILTVRQEYEEGYQIDAYGEITERAGALLTAFEKEADATLRVLFGFDDGQIEELLSLSYLDEEQRQAYVEQIKEGWLK